MNLHDKLKGILADNIEIAGQEFEQELDSSENKDYRRGFKAGVLFSFLHIKSQLSDLKELCDLESIED